MVLKADSYYKAEIKKIFIENWHTDFMISKGKKHFVDDLEALIYLENDTIKGLLTYCIEDNKLEIVSLDSFEENKGIGSLLIQEIVNIFQLSGVDQLWLITTNDNVDALRFYQKRNFSISALYKDAITKARKIKPSIPLLGYNNIPLRHEIELIYNQ